MRLATRKVRVGAKEFTVRGGATGPLVPPRSVWSEFWERFDQGLWEPRTLQKLSALRDGDLFVDIGAWIGPTTLAAAVNGARVLAFEPDPVARDRSCEVATAGDWAPVTASGFRRELLSRRQVEFYFRA